MRAYDDVMRPHPKATEKYKMRVFTANEILHRMVGIITVRYRENVAWYVENPRDSRLWKTKVTQDLLNHPGVQICRCDYCQFGTPFMTLTTVMFWKNDYFGAEAKTHQHMSHQAPGEEEIAAIEDHSGPRSPVDAHRSLPFGPRASIGKNDKAGIGNSILPATNLTSVPPVLPTPPPKSNVGAVGSEARWIFVCIPALPAQWASTLDWGKGGQGKTEVKFFAGLSEGTQEINSLGAATP